MRGKQWLSLGVGLALIAGTAGFLASFPGHQTLGAPGVRTRSLPDSIRLEVDLPEQVLDFRSEAIPVDEVTLKSLPQDTSFGTRVYQAPDGVQIQMNVVLMGADRTSLHKPQYCLEGQGLRIDNAATLRTSVRIAEPVAYDLPVARLVATREVDQQGQTLVARAVYVYWYVAGDGLSAGTEGFGRMWSAARKLLTTGVTQRWAYVSCLVFCLPGQEEPAFERVKTFIAAAVPRFQLYPAAGSRGFDSTSNPGTKTN